MALRLVTDRSPRWVEIGNGAALFCLPATSTIYLTAQARASALLVDLAEAGSVVTKMGGTIEGLPDLADGEVLEGLAGSLLVICAAELAATDWRNILDADGAPIPFDASLLVKLFEDHEVSRRFRDGYFRPLHEAVSEGNG